MRLQKPAQSMHRGPCVKHQLLPQQHSRKLARSRKEQWRRQHLGFDELGVAARHRVVLQTALAALRVPAAVAEGVGAITATRLRDQGRSSSGATK